MMSLDSLASLAGPLLSATKPASGDAQLIIAAVLGFATVILLIPVVLLVHRRSDIPLIKIALPGSGW